MAKDAKPKPKKKETKRKAAAAPAGTAAAKPPKSVRLAERRVLRPLEAAAAAAAASSSDADALVLDRLWQTIENRRLAGNVRNSHSARLLARGTAKVAQKLGEEAVECVIEAAQGRRPEIVLESADVLYHLLVVWVDAGIRPGEVWAELRRREGISGIAEKAARPRAIRRAARTGKLP
jgi:phosphoribosyl-ATP pyrophosphohydrolase